MKKLMVLALVAVTLSGCRSDHQLPGVPAGAGGRAGGRCGADASAAARTETAGPPSARPEGTGPEGTLSAEATGPQACGTEARGPETGPAPGAEAVQAAPTTPPN